METKRCPVCDQEFSKPYTASKKRWAEQYKTCSWKCASVNKTGKPNKKRGMKMDKPAWNKGLKSNKPAWNKGNGEYAKKLGFGKWMTGKKASIEARKSNSERMKKRVAEGRHNFYIDGRTPINQRIRHSLEYKIWREGVFERDDWTCIWCGARNGNGKKIILNADHIKPFAYYPELRFALDNGRTLCVDCHKTTDTYKGRALNFKK